MASSTNLDDDVKQQMMKAAREMAARDPQLAAAFPSEEIARAKFQPGLGLAQIVEIIMEGYAERAALGARSRELITDPVSGKKRLTLLPEFETITYGELWQQSAAIATSWHQAKDSSVSNGDFVCILGFTSPDYAKAILASIRLGAVYVPLQTSAPVQNHLDIMLETKPKVLVSSIEYLDAAVAAILAGYAPASLTVIEYDARDDEQRERLENAQAKLSAQGLATRVSAVTELISDSESLDPVPLYIAEEGEDPLGALFYTSGSTGTPKGAVFPQSLLKRTWMASFPTPTITLSFMPMAHLVGHGYMVLALANGGTSFCSPKADLSTLFEDFALVKPTMASLVPRVCELFFHRYLGELDRALLEKNSPQSEAEEEQLAQVLKKQMREQTLGGRLVSVGCGSASLAPATYEFMESMLGMHMSIGYSSTEMAGGTVLVDWKIQRPPVVDYRLEDVPELGYYNSDQPHPRGELLVKVDTFIPGYYQQPELTSEKFTEDGYFRTGDVMAQLGPDHLVYLDRRNNVQKLSQGEFVAVAKLEALYSHAQDIRQIYIYGTSERAYLLAIVVPSEEWVSQMQTTEGKEKAKAAVRNAMRTIAEREQLNGYEIPRDFILEEEPFSLKNTLLTEVGKHQRPNLKARYAPDLEALYDHLANEQISELRELRQKGADLPTGTAITRALCAILGVAADEVDLSYMFAELGGDSLSALELSKLLQDIYNIDVPVGVIINPASNLSQLVSFIEQERSSDKKRISYALIHGSDAREIKAEDFKLEKFINQEILHTAKGLAVADQVNSVLVTGSTGYLGRFLAVSWLEKLAKTGGKVYLLVRGSDSDQARQRFMSGLASDPALSQHVEELAEQHLEIVAGDLSAPNLGLDDTQWQHLAETIDVIVHCGAHVNHRLPYNQLFPSNVCGTAELIRLAVAERIKPFNYVSTLGVSILCDNYVAQEEGDIRIQARQAEINEGYANGYNISKWGGEVLLRELHEQYEVPVKVFRPGMILAHSHYKGQLNVPDMFTRLLYSLAVTGVAPATFYAEDLSQGRPVGRYEGFSVDFLAEIITATCASIDDGYHSYNLSSPNETSVGLDDFVDWMIDSGCTIERIDSYSEWLQHFETAMHALPEEKQQQSLLALMSPYAKPQVAQMGNQLPTACFSEAVERAGKDMPGISQALIGKYIEDLKYLELLSS